MTDNGTNDDGLSALDAFDELQESKGQSYLRATHAWELLTAFARQVSDEYVRDSGVVPDTNSLENADTTEYAGLALSRDLNDVQRSSDDARGLVNTWPHEMLVTYSDVSDILTRALGGEASDYTAGGAGFTSDGKHNENVKTIEAALGVSTAE